MELTVEPQVESTEEDITEAQKTSVAFEQTQQATEVENNEQACKVEVYQPKLTVEVDGNPQSFVEPGTSLAALELLGGYDTAEVEIIDANEADATADSPPENHDSVTCDQVNQSVSVAQWEPSEVLSTPAIFEAQVVVPAEKQKNESIASELMVGVM